MSDRALTQSRWQTSELTALVRWTLAIGNVNFDTHLPLDYPLRYAGLPIGAGPEAEGGRPGADVGDDQVGWSSGKFCRQSTQKVKAVCVCLRCRLDVQHSGETHSAAVKRRPLSSFSFLQFLFFKFVKHVEFEMFFLFISI